MIIDIISVITEKDKNTGLNMKTKLDGNASLGIERRLYLLVIFVYFYYKWL
jgi:hypothetical protein